MADFAFDAAGGGIAVGYERAAAAVWTSADGARWSRVSRQPAFQPVEGETEMRIRHVARAEAGYVAIGESGPWAVILVSADGVTWSRSDRPPALRRVTLESITGTQGRFVMTGHARNPWRNAIWSSDDMTNWSEVPDVPLVRGGYGSTGMVVSGPRGWLLKTQSYEGDSLWWSADGGAWSVVPEPGDPWDQIARIVATPRGFIALEPSGRCASGVWTSADAGAWDCAEVLAPEGSIYDWTFAVSDQAIVAIRSTGPVWQTNLGGE